MLPSFLPGERLYLRPLEESDIGDRYLGWLNDYETTRFLVTGRFPVRREDLRDFLAGFQGTRTQFLFGIFIRESGSHIGNVTLNHVDWVNRMADTGILIGDKESWGKGYAYEAWSLVIAYAFARLGLRKVIAGAVDGNIGSVKVLKKLGFQVEGTQRKEFFVDGEYRDVIRFGLFREEFHGTGAGPA